MFTELCSANDKVLSLTRIIIFLEASIIKFIRALNIDRGTIGIGTVSSSKSSDCANIVTIASITYTSDIVNTVLNVARDERCRFVKLYSHLYGFNCILSFGKSFERAVDECILVPCPIHIKLVLDHFSLVYYSPFED